MPRGEQAGRGPLAEGRVSGSLLCSGRVKEAPTLGGYAGATSLVAATLSEANGTRAIGRAAHGAGCGGGAVCRAWEVGRRAAAARLLQHLLPRRAPLMAPAACALFSGGPRHVLVPPFVNRRASGLLSSFPLCLSIFYLRSSARSVYLRSPVSLSPLRADLRSRKALFPSQPPW